MPILLRSVETYRTATEEEANELIAEAEEKATNYELRKSSKELRRKMKKGEIEDEWYKVTLQKDFEEA